MSGRIPSITEYIIACSLLLSLAFLLSMMLFVSYHEHQIAQKSWQSDQGSCSCPRGIDIVITWVNGSQPEFRNSLDRHYRAFKEKINGKSYVVNDGGEQAGEQDPRRYQDTEELRFCLRSIEKFAPWVRTIYIVTNGQVPYWLDTQHPQIRLVRHDHIFPDRNDLPTFSSPAIESNLHRIPGLSEHFIYLNDDILLLQPINPEMFYTEETGQKVWITYIVPWFKLDLDAYALSMIFVDSLYGKVFGKNTNRKVPVHGPIYIQKSVMEECQRQFSRQWRTTSSHKFRLANDMQYSFAYTHYLMEKREDVTAMEIFENADTDNNEILGHSEVQKLLDEMVHVDPRGRDLAQKLLDALVDCKKGMDSYWDKLLGTFFWRIRKKSFFSCPKVLNALRNIKGKNKYKFIEDDHTKIQFRMINSNIQRTVKIFKEISESQSMRFVCINNDRDANALENNAIVGALQLQFYEDLFSKPSKFEKYDPFFNDPMLLKPRIRCSTDENKLRIYCLENTGRKFDIKISQDKKMVGWLDNEWMNILGESEHIQKDDSLIPKIAGFIEHQNKTKEMNKTKHEDNQNNVDRFFVELESSETKLVNNKIQDKIKKTQEVNSKIPVVNNKTLENNLYEVHKFFIDAERRRNLERNNNLSIERENERNITNISKENFNKPDISNKTKI